MKKKIIAIVLLFPLTMGLLSATDNPQPQEKMYATLILNFARGMQWPDNAHNSEFVIGVLEYPPLLSELESAATSIKVGSRKIRVKAISTGDDPAGCHVLFVPAFKSRSFQSLLAKLRNEPTLLITNKPDLAKNGAGINFVLVNGKLKYEINTTAIEARGLKISAAIKGMGIVVGP